MEQNRQLASSSGRQEVRKAVLEALEAGRKQQRPPGFSTGRQEASDIGRKQLRPERSSRSWQEEAEAGRKKQRPTVFSRGRQ